jgi:6-phosphogluconolactonase
VFAFDNRTLSQEARHRKGTLAVPGNTRGRQAVGTVKLHPNGRFAYVANRASSADPAGVFVGGENNLAVFAIDPASGEPSLIQNADTHGLIAATFTSIRAGACWSPRTSWGCR